MNRLLTCGTAVVLAFLAGCSDSTVSGDVFIIKGDGTVTPSAGTTVRFIRADSEQAFFEQVRAEALASAHESYAAIHAFRREFYLASLVAIVSESSHSVDTTIEGHYELAGVSKGRYLIFAEYRDNFVDGFWLTPVTIEESEQTVDLNLNTFIGVRIEDYIREIVDQCENCNSLLYKLPSRSAVLASLPK